MKKFLLITFICCLSISFIHAQSEEAAEPVSNWKLSGAASVTMTQSSFSNWASGGQNSIAGVVSGGLNLGYTKDKWNWSNQLDAAYGLMLQGSDRSKTDDRLEFSSKLGYKASKTWSYTALTQFKTQFDKGYKEYPIKNKHLYTSGFFAPAYLTISLGMDYKPNADLSVFLSPLTMRTTFVYDDSLSNGGAYGVDPGDNILNEYGAFIKATYQKKFSERILLKTKLELFSNWVDKPQNIDVNWEVDIDFKVTKWLSTKLYTQLIYDDNIRIKDPDTGILGGPKVQFKEVLGIGLSYIF